jgi:hypothetical protein
MGIGRPKTLQCSESTTWQVKQSVSLYFPLQLHLKLSNFVVALAKNMSRLSQSSQDWDGEAKNIFYIIASVSFFVF